MDPYSAEGELINIHNHFHQGQFQEVADYDTSALSSENGPAARILQLRARVALGDAVGVYKEVKGESDPALLAIGALAEQSAGRTESALATIESLLKSAADNATVQIVGGTVLASAGKADEAIALLSQHDANLDAVALIVQIHLSQNRNDLALKEVVAARRWAQDSLLVNLAESWVGVRVGGERYQQAFYVFEELAQSPASSSVRTLVAQAVSELHLGRTEEAQAALEQALKADPESADAVANLLVLSVLSGGSETAEATANLKTLDAAHPLLADLEEKSELFDKAASKYSAKAAA
ncbi:coatomer subunit epsilon [Ophiostoma piceae UAMH 11346]|uniref:Coatomer subunit epsilon n=1 Tax=Ophiostoma piceae (strain UAMH 11346) TaxID=1262450 RepID=S3BP99_OPHP1|nr:coatomer subunit epsilon [Ophiostoma piceae UAMH 11346]